MTPVVRRAARATVELLDGLRTALPAMAAVFALPLLLLVPLLPELVRPMRFLADVERDRVGRLLGYRVQASYPREHGGRWRRARVVLADPTTWRDTGWLVTHGSTGMFAGVIAAGLWPAVLSSATMPLWWWTLPPGTVTAFIEVRTWPQALTLPLLQAGVYAAVLCWVVPLISRGQVRLAAFLLGSTDHESLIHRVERLTETRAEVLEAHGAELRRIERDLHDGVQAQLVAVSVRIGLAERALTTGAPVEPSLLRDAQTGVEDCLSALRDVIRGVYPPILADRGLGGAVRALAGGQRVPVTVRVPDDLPRPPASVEAAAYFVVAESLTNVSRHSGAARAEVVVHRDGPDLRIMVRDDGRGGADQHDGTGLLGIRRRVAALDGHTGIDSPVNGGTTIEVRLPCG